MNFYGCNGVLCSYLVITQGLYKSYAMLLSLSLCNGGSACHCLNERVYDFLVYGESCCAVSQATIDDIPYQLTRELLSKVCTKYDNK